MTSMTMIPQAPTSASPHDPRLDQIASRDSTADGQFWYGVTTTGVFCRPSCASRTANPKNVRFFPSPETAKAAGFRACRRCHPEGASLEAAMADLVAAACRLIESSETPPSLGQLATKIGFSESHFHRRFKAATGLTPKAYAAAHRAQRLRTELAGSGTITEAIYGAGYNSSSRFYEKAGDVLGMTPSRFRAGGLAEEIRFAVGQSSLGAILVASSRKGVVAILLGDDPERLVRDLQDRFPKANLLGAEPDYEALVAQVVGLVEAPSDRVALPLDIRGTAFQQRVWQALQAIPAGTTQSYAEVAARIGSPKAVRAVAGACAANALAVAIPCHRVVRTDGALSGYAWGVERKRTLLERETSRAA